MESLEGLEVRRVWGRKDGNGEETMKNEQGLGASSLDAKGF